MKRQVQGVAVQLAALLAALPVARCHAAGPAERCDTSGGAACSLEEAVLIQKPKMHHKTLAGDAGSPSRASEDVARTPASMLALSRDFVRTPASMFVHKDCVFDVPSGTQREAHPELDDHHVLKFGNGTNRTVKPCTFRPRPFVFHRPPWDPEEEGSSAGCNIGGGQTSTGPLASYGSPLSSTLQSFTAELYVPVDPVAADSDTWVYWWIGSLTSDYSHVLQPVLGYNKNVGWEITAWDCCPGGNLIRSESVGPLKTNEKIPVSIMAWGYNTYRVQACSSSSGACATLVSTTTGRQTVPLLQLETYNVARYCNSDWCPMVNCNFLPRSSFAMNYIRISPSTTWQPPSSRCWSLQKDCGWSVSMYTHAKGYSDEAFWANPPR